MAMIDIKPPDEERFEPFEGLAEVLQQKAIEQQAQMQIIEKVAIDENITKELHELNRTLKEILREMRKRKV
jgi:hypothetical protein